MKRVITLADGSGIDVKNKLRASTRTAKSPNADLRHLDSGTVLEVEKGKVLYRSGEIDDEKGWHLFHSWSKIGDVLLVLETITTALGVEHVVCLRGTEQLYCDLHDLVAHCRINPTGKLIDFPI